jgi:hypothetical protein
VPIDGFSGWTASPARAAAVLATAIAVGFR